MSTKSAFLISLLLAMSLTVRGQSLFGNQQPVRKVFNQQRETASRPQTVRVLGSRQRQKTIAEKRDTVLYLSLTKRFGWYYGIGRQLTREESKHLPCYYRLTEPDSLGRFTKMEAVNGRGMLTTRHSISTYLVGNDDESDKDANAQWKELLKTVVQWELVPSNGRHLAMESGLDANGNLVYTYIMHIVNDSTIVGHYTDSFGEPISLRSGKKVAKYVQVVLDSLGYERQILYLDDNAYFMRNTDGAYMQKKEYDAQGNVTCLLSCMMNGRPIRDRWGNCGWLATYNEMGQLISKRYVDEYMNFMRMPRLFSSSIGVWSRNLEYDGLRLQREFYLNDNGRKDVTYEEGVHSREWQYNQWGDMLSETSRDKSGQLHNDRKGIAQTFYTYDAKGNMTSRCYRDKDGRFVNAESGLCLFLGKDTYKTTNGNDTIPVYQEIVSGLTTKTIDYRREQIHVVKTDRQGRQTESAYYNLQMDPVEVDSCFRLVTSYRGEKNKQIQEEIRYAFKDTVRTVTVTDAREHTRVVRKYHGKTLLSSFGQTLDDNQEVTGQFGYDALGNRGRSHLEDALYYRVKSGTTYRGANSYMMGRNEYDEPSYVVTSESSSSQIYCTILYDAAGNNVLLDENNDSIKNRTAFRDSLNKVYCVELLTQRAYQLGLRTGDIIVKYGGFCYPQAQKDRWNPRDQLQIESYLARKTKKDVLLLRYDAALKRHKMVSLVLPQGTPGELGFLIQTIHCTQRETDRYNSTVASYLQQKGISIDDFQTTSRRFGTQDVVVVRPYLVSSASMSSWKAGLYGDVIVLATSKLMADGTSVYTDLSDGKTKIFNSFDDKGDSITLFCTADGIRLQQVTLPASGSAIAISTEALPKDEYEVLATMSEQLASRVKEKLTSRVLLFSPEEARSYVYKKTTTMAGCNYGDDQEAMTRVLELLGEQTGGNFLDKGIKSLKAVWITDKTSLGDKKSMLAALKRIDTSKYTTVVLGGKNVYSLPSANNPETYSEVVVIGRSYLFIFRGAITESGLNAIKNAVYDKVH